MTAGVWLRSAGLTKPDEEDEEADKLGEKEDKELVRGDSLIYRLYLMWGHLKMHIFSL